MTYAVRIDSNVTVRIYEPVALDDYDVRLEPGTYDLSPVTITRQPTTDDDAYYYRTDIPAVRVNDGVRRGRAGDAITYRFCPYSFQVTKPGGMGSGFTVLRDGKAVR